MEINLKLNLPIIKTSGNQSKMQIQFPKCLKISYEYSFDNSKCNINNENMQNNEVIINTRELNVDKDIIIKQKHESEKTKLNEESIPLMLNPREENTSTDNKNDKEDTYENAQAPNKEEKIEPSDKNEKLNPNQSDENFIMDTNKHSKESLCVSKNQFKLKSIGPTPRLFERKNLNNNYQSYNHQNKNEEIPKEVVEDLFVTGINDEISENDLLKTFSVYGEVVYSKIIKNNITQKVKGIAFVKFRERKSAFYAMNDIGKIFCKGYPLKIRYNIKSKGNKFFKDENRFHSRNSNEEEKTSKLSLCNRERSRDKDMEKGEIQ